MSYLNYQFDNFLRRRLDLAVSADVSDLRGSALLAVSSGGATFADNISIEGILSQRSIPFDQTSMSRLVTNQDMQSSNFVTGSTGWIIRGNGNVEFADGTFRGTITATGGTIGGFTISATTITATNLTFTSGAANTANIVVGTGATAGGLNSAAAGGDIVFWAGSTFANRATAAFRVTAAGALTATSATISGYVVQSQGFFGGDGSDGVQGDANLTITGSNNTVITRNFTSWTAGSVARTCTITPTGCFTYIKISGNADFTNWTFNWDEKGVAGSSGGAGVQSGNGNDGTAGGTPTLGWIINAAGGGQGGQGGGGNGNGGGGGAGASSIQTRQSTNGTAGGGPSGGTGGTAPTDHNRVNINSLMAFKAIICAMGAGGAGGGSGEGGGLGGSISGAGGTGGTGGGLLVIEVGGNITHSSTTFNARGAVGANGGAPVDLGQIRGGGGGGGGGAGGAIIILYNGTSSGSPTINVGSGAGGSGSAGINGGSAGGAGSAGAAGGSLNVRNTVFA